jgi:hypothetical protein
LGNLPHLPDHLTPVWSAFHWSPTT